MRHSILEDPQLREDLQDTSKMEEKAEGEDVIRGKGEAITERITKCLDDLSNDQLERIGYKTHQILHLRTLIERGEI